MGQRHNAAAAGASAGCCRGFVAGCGVPVGVLALTRLNSSFISLKLHASSSTAKTSGSAARQAASVAVAAGAAVTVVPAVTVVAVVAPIAAVVAAASAAADVPSAQQ